MISGKVCIAGASGYLGRRLVARLRAGSTPVVGILKDRSGAADQTTLTSQGAALAFVDASRLQPYTDALAGVKVAVSCMASSGVHVDASDDFWAIDRDANIRFGLEAVRAGVRHVVLVATFEGRSSRHVSAFSDAKECAVDAIGDACRKAGVAFTVIRPTAYFSDLTDRAFDSVLKDGHHTVIGDGLHRINPVSGDDVAAFLVDCIEDPDKAGREHQVGGPDIFSFREIGMLAAHVLGLAKPLTIHSIPVWGLQLLATVASTAGLVSRRRRRSAALLRWMIYSGTHDAIAPACGGSRLRNAYDAKRVALPLAGYGG
jgi:divinyl chlorophyllide a 8-vinyl-reductase